MGKGFLMLNVSHLTEWARVHPGDNLDVSLHDLNDEQFAQLLEVGTVRDGQLEIVAADGRFFDVTITERKNEDQNHAH